MSIRENIAGAVEAVLVEYGLSQEVAAKLAKKAAKGIEIDASVDKTIAEIRKLVGVEAPKSRTPRKKASKKKKAAARKLSTRARAKSKRKATKKKPETKAKAATKKAAGTRERQSLMRKAWWAEKRIAGGKEAPGDKALVKKGEKLKAQNGGGKPAEAPKKKRKGVRNGEIENAAAAPA